MARYRDPRAPEHRVVFGGVAFVNGETADIEIGEETALLFKSAGIVEIEDAPAADVADAATEASNAANDAADAAETAQKAVTRKK